MFKSPNRKPSDIESGVLVSDDESNSDSADSEEVLVEVEVEVEWNSAADLTVILMASGLLGPSAPAHGFSNSQAGLQALPSP